MDNTVGSQRNLNSKQKEVLIGTLLGDEIQDFFDPVTTEALCQDSGYLIIRNLNRYKTLSSKLSLEDGIVCTSSN